MVLVATQVKRRRGTTAENDAFTGAEGEITVDTEKHELRVHDGVTQGGFKVGSGGSGRNVGDIFYTMRNDTGLAGAVECNGGTYNTADYTGEGSIGELLASGKLPYISLADYATQITNSGVCGVFGWDGGNAFRVPTLRDVFIECGQASELGDYISASIPNLKCSIGNNSEYRNPGNLVVIDSGDGFAESLGNSTGRDSDGGSGSRPYGFSLNASRVSSVYKDGTTTVQPEAVKYRAMVQLATGATDEALATCSEVLADVAGLKSHEVIAFQAPTAANNYTWYRKYADGWVEQGGITATNGSNPTPITLPVEMVDANYIPFIQGRTITAGYSGATWQVMPVNTATSTQTSTQFYAQGSITGYNLPFGWRVEGMSAQ